MSQNKKSQQSPVQGWFARHLIRRTASLSWRATQRLGSGLGRLAWRTPNRYRFDTLRNLEFCLPELDGAERERIARQSLVETCRSIAETGIMWHWPVERVLELERESSGEHLLDQGMEAGRGVLLLAPHIGNWEFLTHYLMRRHQLTGLYRKPRIEQLDELVRSARERGGATLLPATPRGLRAFYKALASGGLVAILPDQEPLKKHGAFAPFFHLPALTITLAAALLRRVPAKVIYGWAQRGPEGFDVHFREAPPGLDDPENVRAATQLNKGVEACIRACPEQYIWSYRRFRTRPQAEQDAVAMGAPPKVTYKGWEA